MKSFINSQFGYCPIVWMFHNRTLNRRINDIHERSLRLVHSFVFISPVAKGPGIKLGKTLSDLLSNLRPQIGRQLFGIVNTPSTSTSTSTSPPPPPPTHPPPPKKIDERK